MHNHTPHAKGSLASLLTERSYEHPLRWEMLEPTPTNGDPAERACGAVGRSSLATIPLPIRPTRTSGPWPKFASTERPRVLGRAKYFLYVVICTQPELFLCVGEIALWDVSSVTPFFYIPARVCDHARVCLLLRPSPFPPSLLPVRWVDSCRLTLIEEPFYTANPISCCDDGSGCA